MRDAFQRALVTAFLKTDPLTFLDDPTVRRILTALGDIDPLQHLRPF